MATPSSRDRCQTIRRRKSCMTERVGVARGATPTLSFSTASSERREASKHSWGQHVGPATWSYEVREYGSALLVSLIGASAPLLSQAPRRIRREDPDHEVDQPSDDQHL